VKNYLPRKIFSVTFYPICFALLFWIVFLLEKTGGHNWASYGVLPRTFSGLKGIFFSVFLHGDLNHIASNTLPILVLGSLLFFFYKSIAKQVFIWIWLMSGLWLWIGGRSNPNFQVYHIGASTLIYGLATFLFFSGVFRKNRSLMVVSALVVFLYGSIMWGIFPLKSDMSWEGHLFGAIAGLLVAFNYRKEGPGSRRFQWEEEEDETAEEAYWQVSEEAEKNNENSNQTIKIVYSYKENEDKLSDK
jgi:membrane associated rhomboid family serine protease